MAEISIIVPIYQSETCLVKCLDSILCQDYRDFQLILVDDGSTDQSGDICDRYEKEDKRIVVLHQSNHGVSAARNAGLRLASGKYVTFVDSDDWLKPGYLSDLLDSDADFVILGFSAFNEDGKLLRQYEWPSEKIDVNKEALLRLFQSGALGFICSKRFRRDLISEYGLHFEEQISHTEDTLFTLDYLEHAATVELRSSNHYCYIKYQDRNTLSSQVTLETLSMFCLTNRLLCRRFFPHNGEDYEKLYYTRVGYGYCSYLRSAWYSNLNGILARYHFGVALWKNEDFMKIQRYAPDAVWKFSGQGSIVSALQRQSKAALLWATIRSALMQKR